MPQPDETSDKPLHIDARDARGAEIILRKRRNRMIFFGALAVFVVLAVVGLTACAVEGEEEACGGMLITAPADGAGSFTVAQLMAHSAAMGMTQQEAETLIYLEGLSPTTRLEPGESRCLDGKPG